MADEPNQLPVITPHTTYGGTQQKHQIKGGTALLRLDSDQSGNAQKQKSVTCISNQHGKEQGKKDQEVKS